MMFSTSDGSLESILHFDPTREDLYAYYDAAYPPHATIYSLEDSIKHFYGGMTIVLGLAGNAIPALGSIYSASFSTQQGDLLPTLRIETELMD
jgi:hypothetical protein